MTMKAIYRQNFRSKFLSYSFLQDWIFLPKDIGQLWRKSKVIHFSYSMSILWVHNLYFCGQIPLVVRKNPFGSKGINTYQMMSQYKKLELSTVFAVVLNYCVHDFKDYIRQLNLTTLQTILFSTSNLCKYAKQFFFI